MGRWLKLEVSWSMSPWVCVLSAESRLAWIELLCYVKTSGFGGRAKAPAATAFARRCFIGEEAVRQMLMAAEADGALQIVDGEWVVKNWHKYQDDETHAERQARYRAKKKQESDGSDASHASRDGSDDKNENENENENENPPISPQGDRGKRDFAQGVPVPDDLQAIEGFAEAWDSRKEQRQSKPKTRFPTEASVRAELKLLASCKDPVAVLNRAVASGWQGLNIQDRDRKEFKPPMRNGQPDEGGRFLN